jgi:hypothetical protein
MKIGVKEMGCGDVAYTHVVQDMAQWRALVTTVINLRVPKIWDVP